MRNRLSLVHATAILCSLLAVGLAGAQTPPGSVSGLAAQSSLSEPDKDRIRSYATYWCSRLATAPDDSTFRDAGRQLRSPLITRASAIFLDEYSRALLPELQKLIEGDDLYRAVNAVMLCGELQTDKALDQLLRSCSAPDEQRWQVRLRAAGGARMLIERSRLAATNPREILNAARALRTAVRDEHNPHVLRHTLLALLATDHRDLPENQIATVRGYIIEGLGHAADQAANATMLEVEHIEAILQAAVKLRDSVLVMSPTDLGQYGRRLAPALARLLEAGPIHWQALQEDPVAKRRWAALLGICEFIVQRVDPLVRGADPAVALPNLGLRKAWQDGQREEYQAQLDRLQGIFAKSPYE